MPLPTNRQCTVEIKNKTSGLKLCNPLSYVHSGICESPLPPTLRSSESGTALFTKKTMATCGSVGVFTYNIVNESSKDDRGQLAVMFSVPFDFNVFSNWYAIGIFDKNKKCDEDLYNEMYYNVQQDFVRGKAMGPSLTFSKPNVTIRASMSDSAQPVLKLELCDE